MQIKYAFNSHITGKNTVLLLSFIVMLVTILFSDFTNYSNYILYPLYLLVWVPCLSRPSFTPSKNERTFVWVSLLFLSIILFYCLVGYSTISLGEVLREFNWIMMGMIAVYVVKSLSSHEISVLYVVFAIALFVLLYAFIRKGMSLVVVEQTEAADTASAWYGSMFMIISGLSLIVFSQVKSYFIKGVSIVFLLTILYLNVFILQRSTNVIFTLAELLLLLVFFLKNKTAIRVILAVGIIAVVVFVENGGLIMLFDWLADIIPSERMAIRFKELSYALIYEDINASEGSSLSSRSDLMKISLDTFTSSIGHFLFGAGDHEGYGVIGHHSFFIDTLAKYGIIGGVLMIVYFVKQYKIIVSSLDKNKDWTLYMQCTVVFVFYLLRNVYGAMTFAAVNLVILVFFPLTFQIIKYYKN